MKKLVVFVVSLTLVAGCQNADQSGPRLSEKEKKQALEDSASYTSILWLDSTSKTLAEVKEGEQVAVSYRFRNTGTHNLVISDASAECGCTTPEIPQQPIAPGKEGEIKATFNSQNRVGDNNKHIFVKSNTNPNATTLAFRITVNP